MTIDVVFITDDSLITGRNEKGPGGHVSIVVEDREGDEAVILFDSPGALMELGHMVNHLLAETQEAPPEEGAPAGLVRDCGPY